MLLPPRLALFALLALLGPSYAAKSVAASFCKCICFNNSTIIALNPPTSSTQASSLHRLDIRSSPGDTALNADSSYTYADTRRDVWSEYSPNHAEKDRRSPASGDSEKEDGDEAKTPSTGHSRPHHKLTCTDCTRAFCLDYNLPICKNAREEDVFTTCFQRDSLKDETVVVVFIFATAGLLAWALVKPWIDRLRDRSPAFIPLTQQPNDDLARTGQTARSRLNRNTLHGAGGGATATTSGSGNDNAIGGGNGSRSRSGEGMGPGQGISLPAAAAAAAAPTEGLLFSDPSASYFSESPPPHYGRPGNGLLQQVHADHDAVDIVSSGSGV
ncbi:hypothetical protein A1O1_03411 [Capronia coronata CBS 617.96]|uniref:Uncharacterized protein n=1 Tax=Capronia coronata CBS 617.96 TaxID=1182541 RepID=W9YBS9_9EURO|nr:uncharacterized protein A1O1_03411 [Capronia coronata CBS 617.96]EXJ90312.1 hypothetical protein A1O1_03411 [Capronia coronata CBS 617.96]